MNGLWSKVKVLLIKLAYLRNRNRLRRFGIPIVCIILAFTILNYFSDRYFLTINNQTISFLIFTMIVTISSWYGGFAPGIFATLISAILSYFTILKIDYLTHPAIGDLIIFAIYLLEGLIISVLSEARYESEVEKDQFVGITAHELKNPLTTIKGFAQLISIKAKSKENPVILRYSQEIQTQTDRVLELINDLLDITKLEIGKFEYKKEFFDFDELVKEVVTHQRVISGKKEIKISGKTKKQINADKYRVAQVITNLLTNAIKYSPNNNKIEVSLKPIAGGVLLSVKDYGIGIPHDEQKQIFSQFYRVRNSKVRKSEGLGLGLYISNQIVNFHKGKLWVKSKPKKGSTFYMFLPKND